MRNLITIGLPSKGRLKESSVRFFENNNLKLTSNGGERNYFAKIEKVPSVKIIYLSLSFDQEKNFYKSNNKIFDTKLRRDIIDRNDSVLVTNVNLYDLGIRPKLLNDIEKKNLLIKLKLHYPDLNFSKIKKNLEKKDFFG